MMKHNNEDTFGRSHVVISEVLMADCATWLSSLA